MRRSALLLAVAAGTALALSGCTANSVLDLAVGDCLNTTDLEGTEVSSVEALECSTEHDAEIFAEHTFSGDEYPGLETVQEESDVACRDAFGDFVGIPYEESALYFSALYPTEDTWDSADDRTTLCIILAEEPMTESLEGAAI
ncbi:septum formation family protein [Georgenia sunbinii]|uniref:septum formation family protein n=1 Tax=Georgenia sunbinii TaxID=3117728 RepID=UPI002F260F8E